MSFWEPVEMQGSGWRVWSVGPRTLWGACVDDEFHLATTLAEEEDSPSAPAPLEPPMPLEISRWILKREPLSVRLLPGLPDRPVVVRPESPIRFPSGRSARIYVSIPIVVRVQAVQGVPVDLAGYPTRELSSIWFGDPQEGVLAYSLAIPAQRKIDDLCQSAHRLVCPVTITNAAPEELEFCRLCLRVEHLGVYAEGSDLWTGSVHVRFRGEKTGSQLDYLPGAPKEIPEARPIAEPRVVPRNNLILRSFMNLYHLAGGRGRS